MKYLIKKNLIVIALLIYGVFAPVMADSPINTSKHHIKSAVKYATKVPIGRKQLAMKFLLAMFGVGVSSVVIYVGLSVYNKLMYGTVSQKTRITDNEDDYYKTPSNMKEALNIFLKKTK